MAISSSLKTVTPRQAQHWLKECNGRNRPLRMSYAERLAKLMNDGDFRVTHQGIAFNCDGTLLDGQHRLQAVIIHGKPVQLLVTTGLPVEALDSVDLGMKRAISDVLAFGNAEITTTHVAVAKVMSSGADVHTRNGMTCPEIARFLNTHWDAIDFACKGARMRGFPASVRGVMARAWYTQDHARLDQFREVYVTGLMDGPGDVAAIRLRNLLHGRERTGKFAIYRKAQNAVSKFLAGDPIRTLYEAPREIFPIPGDEDTPLLDGGR